MTKLEPATSFEALLASLLDKIVLSPTENIDGQVIQTQRELCKYFGTESFL